MVHLIANDGSVCSYEAGRVEMDSDIGPDYGAMQAVAYGDFRGATINRKCVRRLGHFTSSRPRTDTQCCRAFFLTSFTTVARKCIQAFQRWWDETECQAQVILYDLKSNESDERCCGRSCGSVDIRAERIVDVVSSEELAGEIRRARSCGDRSGCDRNRRDT